MGVKQQQQQQQQKQQQQQVKKNIKSGGGGVGLVVVENDRVVVPAFAAPLTNPDPLSISDETWSVAEETTANLVLNCIHPTLDSEEKRKDVTEFVQNLIRQSIGVEVFAYGSVPLKTYLPDGDIDLTALNIPNGDENLPQDVLAVLQGEEHKENAEFEVRDTQFIDAEVKLVKCLVQNIVIDISFNQLGGLCTLCFLEQVDRVVGKNHLFKRSIILIKAWCYYESRILGAHHGLISTYALEALVLYVFNLFNSSLSGPLAVLYRFLDCFSRFDWDKYCVSLDGPVPKSSLPTIAVDRPQNRGNDLLLSEEFLRNCIEMFSVPSRGVEINSRTFAPKNLNIIDPLKENNNLGRSVHRGNYFRIRSAFRYGARKLGRILQLPRNRIPDEIKKFFASTLEMHGHNCGPDTAIIFGSKALSSLSSSSQGEMFLDVDFDDLESEGISNLESSEDSGFIGHHLVEDANDLSAFESLSLQGVNDKSDSSTRSSQHSSPQSGRHYYAPNFYFSGSCLANRNSEYVRPSDLVNQKHGLDLWMEQGDKHLVDQDTSMLNSHDHASSSDSEISGQDVSIPDGLALDSMEKALAGSGAETEILNPLSDLTGDYDNHIRSLLYGQSCHGYALSAPVLCTSSPTSPSQLWNKPWETVQWPMPVNQNMCSQVNVNGMLVFPSSYPTVNQFTPANAPFGWEERQKARGTGTYFPVTNGCPSKERNSRGRGRSCLGPWTNGFQQGSNSFQPGTNVFQQGPNGYQQRGRNSSLPNIRSLLEQNRQPRARPLTQVHGKSASYRQNHHFVPAGSDFRHPTVPSRGVSHPPPLPAQGVSHPPPLPAQGDAPPTLPVVTEGVPNVPPLQATAKPKSVPIPLRKLEFGSFGRTVADETSKSGPSTPTLATPQTNKNSKTVDGSRRGR